jgi:RNase P subunit RPR2
MSKIISALEGRVDPGNAKKLVCDKCGNTKWNIVERLVLTSNPPIHVTVYKCSKCGNKVRKEDRPSFLDDTSVEVDDWR